MASRSRNPASTPWWRRPATCPGVHPRPCSLEAQDGSGIWWRSTCDARGSDGASKGARARGRHSTEPELVRIFRRFDADGDGRNSAAEMREFFGCTAVEADGDEFVSVKKLGELLEGGEPDALRAAFAEYDEEEDAAIFACLLLLDE